MAFVTPFGWTAVVGAVGIIQIAAALRFRRSCVRSQPPLPAPAPPVSIIIPFKGLSSDLADSLRSFLALDYPGPMEWILVAARAEDPSVELTKRLIAGAPRARVVISDARPTRSSEKALNLLAGVAAADPASRVLLFADSDLLVRPDWARLLVAALGEPGTSVSTALMVYRPAGGGLPSWLRCAWMAFGTAWFEPMTLAAGQSLALRREDFDALGVGELWRRVVSDDLALSARVRKHGGRVRLVMEAAPESRAACGWQGLFSQLNRWQTLFRFYQPRVWALGAAATAIKLGALIQALQAPVCVPLLAVLAGSDVLYLSLIFAALGRRFRETLPAALLVPLLWPILAVNYAVSAFSREIVWSGWTYHLDGPTAEAGTAAACGPRRTRLRRLAAAVLGGAVVGGAYHTGWGALIWVGFLPLFWLIEELRPLEAMAWGSLFGTAAYAAGLPCLYLFLRRFLGVGPPEAAFWFGFMSLVQGLVWGACAAAGALCAPGPSRAIVFSAAAIALEGFAPALFPTQFALTQVFHLPTVQCVEYLGTAGLAWLILAANTVVYWLWRRPGWRAAGAAALIACVGAGNEAWGKARLAEITAIELSRPAARLGVVQGGRRFASPSLSDRFSQDLPAYGELTRRALVAGAADLVIWPESTFASWVDYDLQRPSAARTEEGTLPSVLNALAHTRVPLLLNAIGRRGDGRLRNIALLLDASHQPTGVIEKTILAPFGEYMPLGDILPVLYRFSPLTGHLRPGPTPSPLALPGGALAGVLICYEDFQAPTAARLAALGATVFIAQANDSWFDGTDLPEAHLRTDMLRAIENRRALLRATLTGISAYIEPSGRVVSRLDSGQEGVLAAAVPLMELRTSASVGALWLYRLAAFICAAAVVMGLLREGAR
jgi:apolipoprotein N-acyltransferase